MKDREREALAWQTGVWNRMSEVYVREIDRRFVPVVEAVLARAALGSGEHVLDLGTGTGAVAERAAAAVGLGRRGPRRRHQPGDAGPGRAASMRSSD